MKLISDYIEFRARIKPVRDDFDLDLIPDIGLGLFRPERLEELKQYCQNHPQYHIMSIQVGLANHSRVSQWEKKGLKATGMDYPAELTVRLIMAAAIEEQLISKVYKVLAKNRIKDNTTPVELHDDAA